MQHKLKVKTEKILSNFMSIKFKTQIKCINLEKYINYQN